MRVEEVEIHEPVQAVVLAAGKGVRMRSALPKVMHPLAGRPMIAHVLEALKPLQPASIAVVIGSSMESVARTVAPARTFIQDPPQGTGHAVMAARPMLEGAKGTVLVAFGDTPLVTTATLARLAAAREAGAAVVVLGFHPQNPAQYGRLVQGPEGSLLRIVEFKDASPEERAIGLCNAGVMAVSAEALPGLLDALDRNNAQGEYYLTDLIIHARAKGLATGFIEGDAEEVLGVNSRAELAAAEAVLQRRLRLAAMTGGATLLDPDTVYLSADTRLGRDVVIGQNVVIGPEVEIADNVTIHAFSHLAGARVAAGAIIGPFARLRPGTVIGPDAHVGNFVELKNAVLGEGAKANHLSYLGDTAIGAKANIGAGTITCNYDGFGKYKTEIGAGAFIGSNSALVAPIRIGDGAYVGSGSVVTDDVPADALALGRGRQAVKPGWAKEFRAQKEAEKAARKKEGG
jgi:bifunctional UDP-N-acetylglucosamine pyrophosphorylase/glucosamine-1-phosphate N-acetyltransferase